ncbi:MAG: hypothetical protein R3E10_14320 [Gemmatimonadota bacterium]
MLAAIALIGVAAALNSGFFSAVGAPVPMAAAAGLALGAAALLSNALGVAQVYYECAGRPSACSDEYYALVAALIAQSAALLALGAAAGVAAASAWIPGAGQVAMWVIIGLLLAQVALLPSVIALSVALANCVEGVASSRAEPLLIAAGVTAVLAWVFVYAVSGRVVLRPGKGPTASR